LAVELPFTIMAGTSTRPMSIIDNAAIDTNTSNAGAANDSWYYNETAAGSGTILWNISDPAVVANTTQNVGANPFMGNTATEGLFTSGPNLFAALGSTIIASGTTSVNTLQIVTQGGGGFLRMGAGRIGQAGVQHVIPTKDFYVPADWNGDGVVSSGDFNLLLSQFGMPTSGAWDGFPSVNPNVSSADFNLLLQNFGAGVGFGVGAGTAVPEPSSMILFGLGVVFTAISTRRRRSRQG
jgi:hypothetical protein